MSTAATGTIAGTAAPAAPAPADCSRLLSAADCSKLLRSCCCCCCEEDGGVDGEGRPEILRASWEAVARVRLRDGVPTSSSTAGSVAVASASATAAAAVNGGAASVAAAAAAASVECRAYVRISCNSCNTSRPDAFRMCIKLLRASASLPFSMSHRGDSGSSGIPITSTRAGRICNANTRRHRWWQRAYRSQSSPLFGSCDRT